MAGGICGALDLVRRNILAVLAGKRLSIYRIDDTASYLPTAYGQVQNVLLSRFLDC